MPRAKLTQTATRATHSSNLTKRLKLQPSQLAVAFRHIKPSWKHYLDYVEAAAREGDAEMQKLMGAYVGLTRREQATIMPEQLCSLAGVKTDVLFGAVCQQLWAASRMEANVITAVSFPKVIERTARQAMTKGGVRDREMFHRATGFLPQPKTVAPSVVVNNNPQTAIVNGKPEPVKAISLPSMEEEALMMEHAIVPLLESGESGNAD